ncbi:hypothetical protein ANCDUO_15801, partial [Ancylostoma duodenale]
MAKFMDVSGAIVTYPQPLRVDGFLGKNTVSNSSDCNSDAEEENVDASEDVSTAALVPVDEAEGGDGEGKDHAAAAKRRGPGAKIKAKQ